jgi:hypothetical protein
MEIRSQPIGGSPAEPRRADITRSNRESIDKSIPKEPADGVAKDVANEAAKAKRIANARDEHAQALAQRIQNAREKHSEALQKRIANAREEAMADRIRNARAQHADPVDDTSADVAKTDKVELSFRGRALSGDIQPKDDGDRQARVREVKRLVDDGKLNTDELIFRAAHKLLGGE